MSLNTSISRALNECPKEIKVKKDENGNEYKTHLYTLPDGKILSFNKVVGEVQNGHLHGLVLSF